MCLSEGYSCSPQSLVFAKCSPDSSTCTLFRQATQDVPDLLQNLRFPSVGFGQLPGLVDRLRPGKANPSLLGLPLSESILNVSSFMMHFQDFLIRRDDCVLPLMLNGLASILKSP